MSAARQLAWDLTARPAQGRADFFVTDANRLALAKIDGWERWPGGMLLLVGPAGSGKSHLAAVWAGLSGARIVPAGEEPGPGPVAVEDLGAVAGDAEAEERLFHFYNRAKAAGQPVLFTARRGAGQLGLRLPDLVSRLQALDVAAMEPPDDALLGAVLTKQLADRQVEIDPAVVEYVLARVERGFDAVEALAGALNVASLAQRRAITKPLVREVLAAMGETRA